MHYDLADLCGVRLVGKTNRQLLSSVCNSLYLFNPSVILCIAALSSTTADYHLVIFVEIAEVARKNLTESSQQILKIMYKKQYQRRTREACSLTGQNHVFFNLGLRKLIEITENVRSSQTCVYSTTNCIVCASQINLLLMLFCKQPL